MSATPAPRWQSEPRWQSLLSALPPLGPEVELILRDKGHGPTATLRSPAAPPRVFRQDEGGVHELQPGDDAALPGAALLKHPTLLAQSLAPWLGAIDHARLVAWRPGRRAVLRVQGHDGTVHWLKLLDRKTYARAINAWRAIGPAISPMHLCVPSQLLGEHCGYLAPTANGVSLRQLLAIDGQLSMTLVVRGVMALAYTEVRGPLPTIDFQTTRAATLDLLHQGTACCPTLANLSTAIARLVPPPTCSQPGFVHGDLHDKQVFVDADRTTVIDLEGIGLGDTRFDVTNLAEHLRLRDLQRDGRDTGVADQLLARCGLDPDTRATLTFRALVRARLCGVYALRPRWSLLTERLHADALSLLSKLS